MPTGFWDSPENVARFAARDPDVRLTELLPEYREPSRCVSSISVFTPETDLTGRGIAAVPGEPNVFEGFESGRSVLVDAPTVDAELARFGLTPLEPTRTARPRAETGRRVSAIGLYGKLSPP